ncbi:hypothetical protein E4U21_000044 [Claviceps maximensis]|nr:hypothetical protein E4U21_000044 [Claviceps maximensis]
MAASIPTQTEIIVLIWTLWVVASCMTALRLTFEWRLHRRFLAGDYLVMVGLTTLTVMTGVFTRIVPHVYFMAEFFKNQSEDPSMPPPMPIEEMNNRSVTTLKYTFSMLPLFWTTVWAAKFSILFFIRLLLVGLPKYMMCWRICFGVVLALYISCILSQYLTCFPLERNWAMTGCNGPDDIERENASFQFSIGVDIASDLLIMILPLNLLRNLTITKLQKLWLVTVFSLSGIIVAVALVRYIQIVQTRENSGHNLLTAVHMLLLGGMWSHIESTVAIIVATLPALRFIGRKCISKSNPPNSYGLVTIGGTGRSRARPWELDVGSDDSVTIQGSQVDLEQVGGKSSYGISDPSLDRQASSGQSTRPGTVGDGDGESIRRCV